MRKSKLTQKRLISLLHYSPKTGLWTWRSARGNVKAGDRAGCIEKQYGYRLIGVDKTMYRSARLAWFYIYGHWPSGQIDHKNHIRTDDRLSILRLVSHKENGLNQKRHSRNNSGFCGVNWKTNIGKWRAWIQVNKKQRHLGYFDNLQEAIKARKSAARLYGYHPNHGK